MARPLPVSAAVLDGLSVGTSRATGSPRLAITTSSPRCADLISCDSRFLASRILTCIARSLVPEQAIYGYPWLTKQACAGRAFACYRRYRSHRRGLIALRRDQIPDGRIEARPPPR